MRLNAELNRHLEIMKGGEAHTAGNNVSSTLLAVSKLRRYRQLPLLAYAHIQETLIPTFDDLTHTQLEGERLISVQTVTRGENLFRSIYPIYARRAKLKTHIFLTQTRGHRCSP